jgi:hypothetical protein
LALSENESFIDIYEITEWKFGSLK